MYGKGLLLKAERIFTKLAYLYAEGGSYDKYQLCEFFNKTWFLRKMKLLMKSLRIFERQYGHDVQHPFIALTLWNLGDTYSKLQEEKKKEVPTNYLPFKFLIRF